MKTIKKFSVCILSLASLELNSQPFPQYIRETPEDVSEALVNFPERVPQGPTIRTLAGDQLTLGSVKKDFAINREIYNDIAIFQSKMQELMQIMINTNVNPALLNALQIAIARKKAVQPLMAQFLQLLANAGVRYNMRSDFNRMQKELIQIRDDYNSAPLDADYMLFRPRLETIIAEIENALKTKMAR